MDPDYADTAQTQLASGTLGGLRSPRPLLYAGALTVEGRTQFVLLVDYGHGGPPSIQASFYTPAEWEAFVRSVKAAAEL